MGVNKKQFLFNQIVAADPTKNTEDIFNGDIEETYHSMINAGTINPYIKSNGLVSSNYFKWRKALANVRNGSGDAKILCLGDSTTFGYGGQNTTTPPLTSWPAKLSNVLNSYQAPSALGLAIPKNSSDARWSSSWAIENYGFCAVSAWRNGSGTLTYTPGTTSIYDTFDVYYMAAGSAAAFSVTATGGVVTNINTGTLNGMSKTTVTASAANSTNSVVITPTSGTFWIIGVEPSLSTTSKIRIANAGVSGATAHSYLNGGVGNPYGSEVSIQAYAPDLTIINFGINDGSSTFYVNEYSSNMQRLINAAKASGDVLLVVPVPSYDDGSSLVPNEKNIAGQLYTLRATNNLGIVDISSRWSSYAVSNPLGYYYDVLHPNNIGYADIAEAILTALRNLQ